MEVTRILQELDRREHIAEIVIGHTVVVRAVKLGPPHARHRVRSALFRVVGSA